MNEVDYIRQQLQTERSHLREILQAVRQAGPLKNSRAVTTYVDWAVRRHLSVLDAHIGALESTAAPPVHSELSKAAASVRGMDTASGQTLALRAERILAVLDSWTDALEATAARALRVAHWRQAARLNADSILEERQLHAAARGALGLA